MVFNLEQIVRNANLSLKNTPDFIACSIHSTNPPVMAFEFSTVIAADNFHNTQSLLGVDACIDSEDPMIVLQKAITY